MYYFALIKSERTEGGWLSDIEEIVTQEGTEEITPKGVRAAVKAAGAGCQVRRGFMCAPQLRCFAADHVLTAQEIERWPDTVLSVHVKPSSKSKAIGRKIV